MYKTHLDTQYMWETALFCFPPFPGPDDGCSRAPAGGGQVGPGPSCKGLRQGLAGEASSSHLQVRNMAKVFQKCKTRLTFFPRGLFPSGCNGFRTSSLNCEKQTFPRKINRKMTFKIPPPCSRKSKLRTDVAEARLFPAKHAEVINSFQNPSVLCPGNS